MPKRMLIDASHREETRVVVLDGNKVEEFDFEAASRRPLKGNIYLAKVTRVEPSLQAAFVEYGGNRQGFLAFSEIHPDYYQIPMADRMALLAEHEAQARRMAADEDFESVATAKAPAQEPVSVGDDGDTSTETATGAEDDDADEDEGDDAPEGASEDSAEDADGNRAEQAAPNGTENDNDLLGLDEPLPNEVRPLDVVPAQPLEARHARQKAQPRPRRRHYKIQEVIKRRQIMLVQVVKEERGTKGAALTTYLSLAGRYCVLMPNTPRGGGISRKITSATDRKRLKSAAQSLELPEGMGLIIRTAGANRTKTEIKRDYEYLLRLWDSIRELTLKSNAPALVYEEGNIIKRAVRDLYSKDVAEVLVEGDDGYREAKDIMKMLMPSHAKNVKQFKETQPLFQRFHVEAQLDAMFSPTVTLKSGGYIVINQTEALVSIDVNSGKATREHSIEDTATKTNLEAADEVGRQLRMRDLAGLIVIDFIDMEDGRNDRAVEKRLRDAVRNDRARVQIGKISQFGLLEMSRQRLRAGVVAGSTVPCAHCGGQGIVRSVESTALRVLRAVEEEGERQKHASLTVKAPSDVVFYTLNRKRRELARIEETYELSILFEPREGMMGGSFEIERSAARAETPIRSKASPVSVEAGFRASEDIEPVEPSAVEIEDEAETEIEVEAEVEAEAEVGESRPSERGENGEREGGRRRRRRRGGRGRNREREPHEARAPQTVPVRDLADTERHDANAETPPMQPTPSANAPDDGAQRKRRRRRRGGRGRHRDDQSGQRGQAGAPNAPAEPSNSANGGHRQADSAADDVETVVPNTPSYPQWSLTEQPPAASTTQAVPARVREPATAKPVREPAGVAEPAQEDDSKEPTKKGWWQRRFG